jgi:hypothetical protein
LVTEHFLHSQLTAYGQRIVTPSLIYHTQFSASDCIMTASATCIPLSHHSQKVSPFDNSFHITKGMSLKSYLSPPIFCFRLHHHNISHLYSTLLIIHRSFPPFNNSLHMAKGLSLQVLFITPDFPLQAASSQHQALVFHSTNIPKCNHDFVHEVGIWWN